MNAISLRSIALICFMLIAGACASKDEKEIRQILENVETAVEAKRFDGAIEPLSEDYSDNLRQNRDQIVPRLERMFGGYDRVGLGVKIRTLKIDGNQASAITRVNVDGYHGDRRERVFGSTVMGRELQIQFEKRSGKWWIVGSALIQTRSLF